MLSTPRQRNSRKNIVNRTANTIGQHPNLLPPSSTDGTAPSMSLLQNTISRNTAKATHRHAYLRIALAVSLACGTGLALTGCGGSGDATTRIDTTPPTTPVDPTVRTSYNITVRSPVKLINVKASATDAATGTVLGTTTIASGNDLVIAVPVAYTKNGNLVVITLSPVDSTSSYFDPMLNNGQGNLAPFNQSLHSIVSLFQSDITSRIDPFSEIVYQRALTRSGVLFSEQTFGMPQPSFKTLAPEHLTLANNDLSSSFGVSNGTQFSGFINSSNDIAALRIYSTANNTANPFNVVNTQVSNELVALGQIALYAQNNASETPYLNFALRAALDMRDGDLDGMTINGGEKIGTALITSPILYSGVSAPVNSDPNRNNVTNLLTDNTALREAHGTAVKQAAIQFFNSVNAAPTSTTHLDADTLSYIQDFNYANFTYKATSTVSSTRTGAGNFTYAFGLPTGTDFKNLLDANDGSGRSNDIMQLNGVYKNSSGCQLNIGYEGTVQLSQGSLSFTSVVNRKSSDSLTRLSGDNYLLNVTSADQTAPRFIQVRTVGGKVISATTGRSTQAVPITLDTTDLTCAF
ncbi:hypothetical protein [Aquirhabdus sp.]|uniref:hypothetical protein n=1 Tax=Aquirhabdus sp. TaxID=2824160 RepID=UPI00396CD3EC